MFPSHEMLVYSTALNIVIAEWIDMLLQIQLLDVHGKSIYSGL